jgi:TonB family protein
VKLFGEIMLLCAMATSLSCAQEVTLKVRPLDAPDAPHVKVYAVGNEVSAPTPLSDIPLKNSASPCKRKLKGKVEVAFIVDAAGEPRNLYSLRGLGSDLDKMALVWVGQKRFKPGLRDGSPVAVGQSVEMKLEGCYFDAERDGQRKQMFRLVAVPEQKFSAFTDQPDDVVLAPGVGSLQPSSDDLPRVERIDEGVTEPRLIYSVEAAYSEQARKAKAEGTCVISLIVDAHGMPQGVHVSRALGLDLDEKAVEAVRQYRFKPAMKNGQPVAVKISVEVRFRLY